LRKANVQAGKKVLIVGAGGSIGTFAIQLASHFGAEVTGVDSTDKMDMLRSIGAKHVIDYTKEDYTKNGEIYDLIIDVVGRRGVSRRLNLLKPDGYYFLAYAGLSHILLSLWTSLTNSRKFRIEASSQSKKDLIFLKELIEAEKLKVIIDKSYPLERVPEAHHYVESGSKKGNVVITV
jgi:NADPH:quinone reductase-like Zn-dependent oxidoreductase